MHTLLILIDKEFRQLIRNPFLPRMIIAFPILVMLIIPLVTTMDVKHIGVAIVDNDHSTLSRRIISDLEASDYFTACLSTYSYNEAHQMLQADDADVIVSVPADFEKSILFSDMPYKIDIAANAVNSTKGSIGMQYVIQSITSSLQNFRSQKMPISATEFITVQNRYNPTLNYRYFMIPALMTMLIVIICGFIPALNIVAEKENGTIEQLNVTPVSKITFTLGKLIPFWIIGFFVVSTAMLLARFVYGLVPSGNLWSIYLGTALLIFTISGLGISIANISYTMQQTMFVMFFFVVLFILMSGLITPIASMPDWAQKLTFCFPTRYFISIMRSVYLKGTTMYELSADYLALVVFALVLNLLAAITYRKKV